MPESFYPCISMRMTKDSIILPSPYQPRNGTFSRSGSQLCFYRRLCGQYAAPGRSIMMSGPGRAYDTFIKTTINPKILFFSSICVPLRIYFHWVGDFNFGRFLQKIASQSRGSYIAFKLASQPIHFVCSINLSLRVR